MRGRISGCRSMRSTAGIAARSGCDVLVMRVTCLGIQQTRRSYVAVRSGSMSPRRDATDFAHFLGGASKVQPIPALSVRSDDHTSEHQSLMRNSYTIFYLKKKQH